jgi:hypothetical protein
MSRFGAVFGIRTIYAHSFLFNVGGGQLLACIAKGLWVAVLNTVVPLLLVEVVFKGICTVGAGAGCRLGVAADLFSVLTLGLFNAIGITMLGIGSVGVGRASNTLGYCSRVKRLDQLSGSTLGLSQAL